MVRILLLACISLLRTNVSGLSSSYRWQNKKVKRRKFGLWSHYSQHSQKDEDEVAANKIWMKRGLLISSFQDGVLDNPPAQEFLMESIKQFIWADHQQRAEQAVHDSAVQSPCCGPNMAALEALEQVDQAMTTSKDLPLHAELRLVYVPTAMYAIRSDSQNTPGKQRQRARADGRQRRNTIVQFLQEKLGRPVNILAVTVDLDDGSVKHAETSDSSNTNNFPKNGMEALQQWAPHVIYVEGGNTFWLHYCMSKGGWDAVLKQACQKAVYIGKSAGAILAGYSVETACWKGWDDPSIVPGMSQYGDWKGVRGLGLVGKTSFFPHMADEWEERVANHGKELFDNSHDVVCCLTDQQACCVDGVAKRIDVISAATTATALVEGDASSRQMAESLGMD